MRWLKRAASLLQPWDARQRRLSAARSPMTEEVFVDEIRQHGGDVEAARLIRAHLIKWGVVDGFTPYPSDDLHEVYGIAEEELERDLIGGVLEELALGPPRQEVLTSVGRVDTPLQIARLVHELRGMN